MIDIDMDIDLGPIDLPEASEISVRSQSLYERCRLKAHCKQALPAPAIDETLPDQPTEVSESNAVTHKVHIKGVDDLTTDHVQAFVAEHCSTEVPTRFEWVDDSSINIVYGTPAAALRALESFTLLSDGQEAVCTPTLQLRPAKILSNRPDTRLHVRTAVATDVKRSRAHEASRFYMMNPELDPRASKMRRRYQTEGDRGYQKPHYGDAEHRRRRHQDRESRLKDSIYDDPESVKSKEHISRRSSVSRNSSGSTPADDRLHGRRRSRQGHSRDYYRPRESPGHSVRRNRSASPGKFNDIDGSLVGQRLRQRTPPPPNHNKELFPVSSTRIAPTGDLMPNKQIAASLKKELFPTKTGTSLHRRTGAFDAADETADLFAAGMAISDRGGKASVGDASFGRLRSSDPVPQYEAPNGREDRGIIIRGASKGQESGVSIRGAAGGSLRETKRELFPSTVGNVGKELFAEKLHGRGLRRNKAEDMFYLP
ncbi:MAG: hypothetical protein Q9169_001662 [Polycauliona sp. 2 TL-2023]